MSGNTITTIIGSLATVLLVTTLVLPGRQTAAVAREGGTAGQKIALATLGIR